MKPLFSDLVKRRQRIWWSHSKRPWDPLGLAPRVVRRLQLAIPRSRTQPQWLWRSQPYWQRCLNNKWNSREFAVMHGFRVPALYDHARNLAELDVHAWPEAFVVRPAFGHSRRGVFVVHGERELLRHEALTRAQLLRRLQLERGAWSLLPVLVEEFVRTEAGAYELPLEYRCYAFNGHVAAISCDVRLHAQSVRKREYYPDWTPVETPLTTSPEAPLSEPPACLPAIVDCAQTLSRAYRSFVRVDCYATDRGCVFGEFSSSPKAGRNFTPFGDRLLGEAWQRYAPGAL